LPSLHRDGHGRATQADGAGLAHLPLPLLPTDLQRAHRHALQAGAGADGRRPARGAVALAVQTAPARLGGNVPGARLRLHARDGARLGGALRPAARRADAGATARRARSGTRMRRMSGSMAAGVTCTARSTGRGISSTRDSARRGTWTRPSDSSVRRSIWPKTPPCRSRRTGTTPTRAPSARRSALKSRPPVQPL